MATTDKDQIEQLPPFDSLSDRERVRMVRTSPLPTDYIMLYGHLMNWGYMVRYQKLSQEVLIKFAERINWKIACATQEVSFNTAMRLKPYMDWGVLITHQKYTAGEMNRVYANMNPELLTRLRIRDESRLRHRESSAAATTA